MKKLLTASAFLSVASIFGIVGNAQAATISALTGYSTMGGASAGMQVRVTFADNTTSTGVWSAINFYSGVASADGWTLSQSGDTFGNPWTFSNNSSKTISSLFINAIAGSTLFDRTNPDPGTPGSAAGWDFTPVSGSSPTSFTYSNIVNLVGQPAVGDLYAALTINWDSGFSTGSNLSFIADTDSAISVIDSSNPQPVPVPAAFMGIGLAGAFFAKREISRRQKSHKA
ncbi:hypothetical protein [Pseudanabaena sp. 'Roaring Creek']|uniref:hypothetical protein n=1 Tax=Pseudanabaena sp. 'Roaring Creek' TaxID=1681830 RepID=UPI0006D7E21B|nr:hypothetical protein [Pseudanabaena sp. 'Roaring Creek']